MRAALSEVEGRAACASRRRSATGPPRRLIGPVGLCHPARRPGPGVCRGIDLADLVYPQGLTSSGRLGHPLTESKAPPPLLGGGALSLFERGRSSTVVARW